MLDLIRNFFRNNNYSGYERNIVSSNQILIIALSIISFILIIYIIANLGMITAKIAIGIVKFLTLGFFPILIFIIVLALFIKRLK